MVLEKKILLTFVNVFSLFCYNLGAPFWICVTLQLNKHETSFSQGYFVLSFMEIELRFRRRAWTCVKYTYRWKDDGQQATEKRTLAFSLGELNQRIIQNNSNNEIQMIYYLLGITIGIRNLLNLERQYNVGHSHTVKTC